MNMSVIQSLVMGFVSGLAEMLPISADAHRLILRTIFGIPAEDALFRLFCHLAILGMLFWEFQPDVRHLHRTSRLMKTPPRQRRRPLDPAAAGTVRLMKSAILTLFIMRLLLWKTDFLRDRPAVMTLTLTVNGLVLLIPALVPNGDMDSRNMPRIMGVIMGVLAGLGGIPGFSAIGAVLAGAMALGVERHYALRFGCILLLPNAVMDLLFDLAAVAAGGIPTVTTGGMIVLALGAVTAGLAVMAGAKIMRSLADGRGFDSFAYYCWGAALLCYILFLIV